MPKVFLSAGHGGTDPGAVAYDLKEKDINLQVLLACKAELERHGVEVVASRLKDENDRKEEEVREANASGASLAVSFHINAGKGDGFEVFYLVGSVKDRKIAELCEKHIKALGQNSRGLKSGAHLYWCKYTRIPCCLVESFFIDNDTDNDIGDTLAEQKAFGVAYAKAILEYFGIPYKEAEDLTKEDVLKIIKEYEAEKAKKAAGAWSAEAWAKAKAKGTLDGTAPQSPVTREQLAVILDRLKLL